MCKVRLTITLLVAGVLLRLPTPAQSQGIEQQLRALYLVASVGQNGVVVRQGSVVVIQQNGITALPVDPAISPASSYWPNSYKKGGRIGTPVMQRVNYSPLKERSRALQVGERAYLTSMQVKPSDIVFGMQTCPADSNEPPARASLTFQFPKGYQTSMDFRQIQEAIGNVLGLETSDQAPPPVAAQPAFSQAPAPVEPAERAAVNPAPPAPEPEPAAVGLGFPAVYANLRNPADQLQLNADYSFSLQQAGQALRGTFAGNGNSLELTVADTNAKTTATLHGNNLVDSNGQIWILRSAPAAPAASDGSGLQNEDVLKMVKAGLEDAIVIAKISGSKCRFDTSTDALIQLKQSGVSSDVLKAMVLCGR